MPRTDDFLVDGVDYRPYLTTLRRIPPEVRQSMATREFDMISPWACVCGWAIRDAVLAATGEDTHRYNSERCAARFGGTYAEWEAIFCDVCYVTTLPAIETAFTIAVAETVPAPRRTARGA